VSRLSRALRQTRAGCSKRPSSKAACESKPEAYPLGYVEDFDEPRTPLAAFFSILLCGTAFRTKGGFFCCFTLLDGQGEELFALPAGANFEVGGSLIVDVGG
jgi:hypothetical protein